MNNMVQPELARYIFLGCVLCVVLVGRVKYHFHKKTLHHERTCFTFAAVCSALP